VGISILGALASNLVQLTLARWLAFGRSAWLIAPPFLLVGLVSPASSAIWLKPTGTAPPGCGRSSRG
jgi:uncharacterized membrane protein